MNKKYLSALLFGALTVASTGTFTSCKDYDDDITSLQEQITQQSADLKGQIAAANTAISSLQTAQKGLEAQVGAAKDAAAAAKEAAVVADANAQTAQKAADAAKAVAEKAKEAADAAKASGDAAAIAAANADLKAAEAAKQAAKAILDAAEADKKAAAAQVEAAAAKQAAAQAEANAIAKAAAELKEAKAELTAEIEKLKSADKNNADAIAKIEAEILKIKGQMDQQLGAINAVTAKADKNAEDIVAINKAADELGKKVTANVAALAQVDKDLAVVATRLNGLDEAVKGLNAAIAKLQEKDEALQKNITALEAADKELANSIKEVSSALTLAQSTLEGRIQGLKEEIDAKLLEHNKLIGQLQTDLKMQKEELAAFKQLTTENFEAVNAALEESIADLQGQLDAAAKKTEEYIASNDKRVADLEGRIDAAEKELATVDARISKQVAELQAALALEIDKLQGLIDANANGIEANKQAIEVNKQDIAENAQAIIAQGQELQGKIDALASLVDANNKSLTEALEAVKNELAAADEALKGDITALDTKVQSEIARVEKAIDDAKSELLVLIAGNKGEITKVASDLKAALTAHANDVKALNDKIEDLQNQINTLNDLVAQNKADIEQNANSIKDNAQKLIDEIARVEGILNDNKSALETLIAEREKELQDQIDALNTSITEKEQALQELMGAKDDAVKEELKGIIAAEKEELENLVYIEKQNLQLIISQLMRNLESADKALQAGIDTNSAAIKELVEKTIPEAVNALRTELNDKMATDIAAAIAGLKPQFDGLQSQIDDNRSRIETLENLVKELEGSLNAKDKALQGQINEIIEKLQSNTLTDEQVNSLIDSKINDALKDYATKEDVTAEIKQAITTAIAKLTSAGQVGQNTQDIAALKAGLTKLRSDFDKLNGDYAKFIDETMKQVTDRLDRHEKMVTSVNLAYDIHDIKSIDKILEFTSTIEKNTVFGKGLEHEMTFSDQNQTHGEDSLYLRVSPVDAILDEDMLSFVGTDGKNIDDYVKATKVEPVTEKISRASEHSGLWKVKVSLKKVDNNYAALIGPKGTTEHYVYAVQVNNKAQDATTRYATSEYDLELRPITPFLGSNDFDFTVQTETIDGLVRYREVDEINNRFDFSNCPSLMNYKPGGKNPYKELQWSADAHIWEDIKLTNPGANVVKADLTPKLGGDDRHKLSVFPVVQSKPITIKTTDSNVKAMYITLDLEQNAVESNPSEWNAWNDSYTYTGLNTVVPGKELSFTIDSKSAINDIIGFRVYAVNMDGTLVDPDGRAFYVSVGDVYEKQTFDLEWKWSVVKGTVEPFITKAEIDPDLFAGDWAKDVNIGRTEILEVSKVGKQPFITNAKEFGDENDTDPKHQGDVVFIDKDGQHITSADKLATAKYLTLDVDHFTATFKPYQFDDDSTYTAKIAYRNASNHILKVIIVNFKKVLPTIDDAPKDFKAKDKQIVNGVYNCYLNAAPATGSNYWVSPTVVNEGYMEMGNVFNGLLDSKGDILDHNYIFNIAKNNTEYYNVVDDDNNPSTINDKYRLVVESDSIGLPVERLSQVFYNFGPISSKSTDPDHNHLVNIYEYYTRFACVMDATTWSWDMETGDKNPAELVYNTDRSYSFIRFKSTNSYSSALNLSLADLLGQGLISVDEAELVSDNTHVSGEYFTVEVDNKNNQFKFKKNPSTTTTPTDVVPSTLNVSYTDVFGHKETLSIPFKVLPNR